MLYQRTLYGCQALNKNNYTNYLGFRASMYFLYPGLSGHPQNHWVTKQTKYGRATNRKPTITGKHQHLSKKYKYINIFQSFNKSNY